MKSPAGTFLKHGALRMMAAGVLCSLFSAGPSSATADTLRCGDELVVRGQRPYEVLERCGSPYYEDRRVEWRYPGFTVYVDEWVYDGGNNRFRRELLFENGRLVDINLRPKPRT